MTGCFSGFGANIIPMTGSTDGILGAANPDTDLRDPRHRELYAYWLAKKGARRAPRRADIDPVDLPALLPYLFIFEVFHEPRDYVMRLLGTTLVAVLGRDFTGAHFREMYDGGLAARVREQYDHVVDQWQPVYDQLDASWMAKDYILYERLLLPLSNTGERVDRLLGCSFFLTPEDLENR